LAYPILKHVSRGNNAKHGQITSKISTVNDEADEGVAPKADAIVPYIYVAD
jgi:hypothetical protein